MTEFIICIAIVLFLWWLNRRKDPIDEFLETLETQCPVCGYYCRGRGGVDCIDKPSIVEAEFKKVNRGVGMKRWKRCSGGIMPAPDGPYVMWPDLQAWTLKLKEVVEGIDLRPWNDCACETCQSNIALQEKALRLLGEVLG